MITRQDIPNIKHGQTLFCANDLASDKRPTRARVNGKPQVWKTRPNDFRIPMVYGLRGYFQLTQRNSAQWFIDEQEALRHYNAAHKQTNQN